MEKSDWKGIGALVAVVLVAFVVIVGTKAVTNKTKEKEPEVTVGGRIEELSTEGYHTIKKAEKYLEEDGEVEGYQVLVETQGYGGPIQIEVAFDSNKTKIETVKIIEQQETEGLGSKITQTEFLEKFKDKEAPVLLGEAAENKKREETIAYKPLQDGSYKIEGKEYDGYTDLMSMTVTNGKIVNMQWDMIDAEGTGKRLLSDKGEYAMSETGLTWSQQADALAAAVIERQGIDFLTQNEEGKTDAVAGVSISINSFVSLAEECIKQAAGVIPKEEEVMIGGSRIDGISGATISSKAVEKGINDAYDFIKRVG